MADVNENRSEREMRNLIRARTTAILARDTVVARIRSIVDMSAALDTQPALVPRFLVAANDLETLWESFLGANQEVLDAMLDLDCTNEFSITQVRQLYVIAVSVVEQYKPSGAIEQEKINDSNNLNDSPRSNLIPLDSHMSDSHVPPTGHSDNAVSQPITTSTTSNGGPNLSIYNNNIGSRDIKSYSQVPLGSRLPEIPLPSFSGDILGWPVFRDRFTALVVCRQDLTDIERFYYLLGCLRGEALIAVRNITVSERNYALAWSTLTHRFDKPRQLATLIVEKLICTPPQSQESLDGLREFLNLFSDNVSMLQSLEVPDLGEFLLFSLSMRCLPVATRKGFEAVNNQTFPKLADIVSYVLNRLSLLEVVNMSGGSRQVSNSATSKYASAPRRGDRKPKASLITSRPSGSASVNCLFCSGRHESVSCNKFLNMSVEDRFKIARDKRVCFRCLNFKHWSTHCKAFKPCDRCSGRHHSLLHRERDVGQDSPVAPETSLVNSSSHHTVLLGTALVHIKDRAGCMHSVRALIDSASQVSTITTSCVDRLGLQRSKWTVPLTGLSGVPVPSISGMVECCVTPRYNVDHRLTVKAWILPKITGSMPSTLVAPHIKDQFSHLALADPSFDRPAPIDLLLGADVFAQIMDGKRFSFDDSSPTAFGSLFGWIIIGPIADSSITLQSNLACLTVSLEDMVQRFWRLEEPELAPSTFTADGRCEGIYCAERVRDDQGRFSVPLTFLTEPPPDEFSGSRQVALRRFQNLERKLTLDNKLAEEYYAFICNKISTMSCCSLGPVWRH